MSKSSITLKGTMDPAAFAHLLEDLAKSVKAGTVCLQKGGEYVTLKPAGGMEFEVEAAVKKGKQKLSVAVKWEEPCEIVPEGEIKITSVEPEPPVVEPVEEVPAGDAAVDAAPELAGGPLGMNEAKETEKKTAKKK